MDDSKIGITDLINDDALEDDRICIWEAALKEDGKCLHADMVRRREIIRKRMHILELVREHRDEFAAMVERGRQPSSSSTRSPRGHTTRSS